MSAEICIWLSPADRAELEGLVADRNTPQKLVWRSRIVLLSAAGSGTMSIMRAVGKSKPSVWRWQERYLAQGIDGLRRDATRPGRKPPLTAEKIAEVVEKTLHEKPPAATHWSTRTMARGGRPRPHQCATDLECARTEAASDARFQIVERQ